MRNLFLVLTLALAVSACNTVSGIGQDMKSAGQSLQKAAD